MRTALISLGVSIICAAPALADRTFGLVIGIDDYTYVTDLHGAVNDANDIADALNFLGADVTLLTDAKATRAAVLGAWEDILDKAKPGDRLVVSYAGHGSNEPEHTKGNETDGRDENFLLAGYAPRGEAAAQRIRDDEIADLLARSADMDVIFVADACHAGTVTRNLNPVLGYRYVTPEELAGDPLPPPPPPPASGGTADVALFLAAVNEAEKVPEIMIDGEPRGALSYAFADGLRGAADLNADGQITKGELEVHVRRTVRQISDGAQLPQSEPAGFENRSLITLATPFPPMPISEAEPEIESVSVAPEPTAEPNIAELPFQHLPLVDVTGSGWEKVTGVRLSVAGALRLDGTTVLSGIGDRVALVADASRLQAVANKHRLVAALHRIARPPLGIRFDQGDRIYQTGQHLAIRIEGRRTSHLTLINLDANGTVSLLYPNPQFQDPVTIAPRNRIDLPVQVTAPFGADHVIALETHESPNALRDALTRLNGTQDAAALWELLRAIDGRLAVFPFFTAERSL